MDQRRVIELVEQFRAERGEAVLEQLVAALMAGVQDRGILARIGLNDLYWLVNLAADGQKAADVELAEQMGQPDVAAAIRSS